MATHRLRQFHWRLTSTFVPAASTSWQSFSDDKVALALSQEQKTATEQVRCVQQAVTVQHTISGPRGTSFVEQHDIVYREAAKPGEAPKPPRPAPADATWTRTILADPVLLFRFSALTFNGHRIHYDQPYVTGVEGYPGLIVHGPLMGMLQIELARRSNPGKVVKSFEFRALSPVFGGATLGVHGRREADGSIATWIADPNGGLAQQGKATFR